MAIAQDYLSLSIIAKLASQDGTRIEYELPTDLRSFENYATTIGYNVIKGEIAAAGNASISLPSNYRTAVIVLTDQDCNFELTGGNAQLTTLRGKMVAIASGSTADVLASLIKITNNIGATGIEYLIATFG